MDSKSNELGSVEITNLKEKEYASVSNPAKDEKQHVTKEGQTKLKTSLLSKDWYKKFASVKGIKLIIPIILLCVLGVVYISLTQKKSSTESSEVSVGNYLTATSYVEHLEARLAKVLSNVKGAGNVSVMVTIKSGPELVYATNTNTKTNTVSTGSSTTTDTNIVAEPIIVSKNGESNLLVLMEKMPDIKGVIVVCSGAVDTRVRLDLLQAVQTLLDVSSSDIQIITGI